MNFPEQFVRTMQRQDLASVMAVHQKMQKLWRAKVEQVVPLDLIEGEIDRANFGAIPNLHFVLESGKKIQAALHAVGRRFSLTDGYFLESGKLPSNYQDLIASQPGANAVFFFAVTAGGGLGGQLIKGAIDIIASRYQELGSVLTFSPLVGFDQYMSINDPGVVLGELTHLMLAAYGLLYLMTAKTSDPVVPMLRPLEIGERVPFHQENGGKVVKLVSPGVRPDSPYVSAIVDYTPVLLATRKLLR